MKRVLAAVLGAGLFLAGCGQQASQATLEGVPDAYRDQTGADWSYTAPTGGLQSLALSDDLASYGAMLSATSSWGPIEINMSNGEKAAGDGRPLTMGGKVYATGLGLHARAEIKYKSTQATGVECKFSAAVGIDDEVGNNGSVRFQAFADGVKLYDSGVLRGSDAAAKQVAFTFPSAKKLSIRVTDAGDNNYFDHTDIADPSLNCSAAQPQLLPSITLEQTTLDVYHLHTATLDATFNNYPKGTYQIQLVPQLLISPSPQFETPPPLVLQTTTVNLTGAPSQVVPLTIYGETYTKQIYGPNYIANKTVFRDDFYVVTIVNGKPVTSPAVNMTEQPIKFTVTVDPSPISGRDGETKTGLLIVTADPPLDGPVQLSLRSLGDVFSYYRLDSVGPTTGTGARMSSEIKISFIDNNPFSKTFTTQYVMQIGDITNRYRDLLYGTQPTSITYTLLP